jgi:hypothetical protein
MKAGVGYCNSKNALSSGRQVAENAMQNGRIEKPCLVLAFCNGRLDHNDFYEGLRSIVGPEPPVVGGSAVGIITNRHLSYEGYPAGAAIIQSDGLKQVVASVDNLDKDERVAGRRLAERLSNDIEGKFLLVFYDSVKIPPTESTPPVMNASPLLLEGLEEAFASAIPIIGAGVLGDFGFSPTKQFCGSYVDGQTVVGTLLGGDIEMDYTVMHGCTPKDGIYHTITQIEGPIIYEVDGKPVVSIIDEMYGNQDWQQQRPVRRLTIGVNLGERFGDYNETEYVNRLITGVLPEGRGIVIFEPDLVNGTEIQFMLRDSDKMIESARKNSLELVKAVGIAGRKPFLGLYIDCAGRTASFSDTRTEEASEVCDVLNHHRIPMLGFFSGVEIAPLVGKSRGLDWTGVLLILSRG